MTGFRWQFLENKSSSVWKQQEGRFENRLLGPVTSGGLVQEAFVCWCCFEHYTKEALTRKAGDDEKGKNLKKSQDLALQFVEKFLAVASGFFLLRRAIQCNHFWKCLYLQSLWFCTSPSWRALYSCLCITLGKLLENCCLQSHCALKTLPSII